MTFDEVNALSASDFSAKFGHLFEHSPWVIEAAEKRRPFADKKAMLDVFASVLDEAEDDRQLALLRAHPELAGKAAIDGSLTKDSTAEQASAGLDRLTEEEFKLFHERNAAYAQKFGFPFIICVRLTNKAGILEAMRARLGSTREAEFKTALGEVMKIVDLRLEEALQ
jgi:2-oxo-4-hydroxy-4-carboxy-5-ureidoimidazoline decarboxylase